MIYRSAPRELAPLRASRASLWRRAKASLRGLPQRLEVRRAWLSLPAGVRLVLREAGLRRKLLDLASAELLTQATERVREAWECSTSVYRRGNRKIGPLRIPRPLARNPTDMQRAVACSATSVPEAVEALRAGLWKYWLINVVRGR